MSGVASGSSLGDDGYASEGKVNVRLKLELVRNRGSRLLVKVVELDAVEASRSIVTERGRGGSLRTGQEGCELTTETNRQMREVLSPGLPFRGGNHVEGDSNGVDTRNTVVRVGGRQLVAVSDTSIGG